MRRCALLLLACGCAGRAAPQPRTIPVAAYRDKVQAAWIGQIIGAIFGWPFEGKPKNVIQLDHYLRPYTYAPVDDDYFYEMVALYGFERHGLAMTVEQLGEMWKEHQAGSWGSSEQTRLALEKGIRAPMTGHPRYNRWFHTIGPQFSADLYGMISPGMLNLAGSIARTYSHVNGYAEGSDGAVFVAACVSEAFLETAPARIVRQAARLIHRESNYRKAIDQILEGYAAGRDWRRLARESEQRWRPDYPQMNNSVANGALVALAILYGEGDYLKSLNVVTQAGDYTDADCNAANVGAVLGAMNGMKAIPRQLAEPLNDRIYGEAMGPVKFRKPVEERISDLAARIAALGQKHVTAHGASLHAGVLSIPRQVPRTQKLERFDINDYGELWNADWRLEGAGRGGTYLDGDTLITLPRDTRPCRLERQVKLPEVLPELRLKIGAAAGRPWRLQVFVDDEGVAAQLIEKQTELRLDLGNYAGRNVRLRLYHSVADGKPPAQAYWHTARVN